MRGKEGDERDVIKNNRVDEKVHQREWEYCLLI